MCFTATDPGEWQGADLRDPEGQPARACADFGTGTPGRMASRGGPSGLREGPNPQDGPLSCRRSPNELTRHPSASSSSKGAGRTRKDPSPMALQVGPFLWPERRTPTDTTTTSTHPGACAPRRVRTSVSAHPHECAPRRTRATAIVGPKGRLSDHGECAPWRVRTSTSAHRDECAPRRGLTTVIGGPNVWLPGHDECAPRRVRTWASAHRGECAPKRVRTAAIGGPNEWLADHGGCAPPRVRTWASEHRGECAPRRMSTAAIGGPNEWLSDHNECAPRPVRTSASAHRGECAPRPLQAGRPVEARRMFDPTWDRVGAPLTPGETGVTPRTPSLAVGARFSFRCVVLEPMREYHGLKNYTPKGLSLIHI